MKKCRRCVVASPASCYRCRVLGLIWRRRRRRPRWGRCGDCEHFPCRCPDVPDDYDVAWLHHLA